jgi:hypothetical protein
MVFKLALFVMLPLLGGSAAAFPIGLCGTGSADCQPPAVFLVTVPPAVGPNGVTGPVYLTQAGNGGSIEKGDWTNIYETAFNMQSGFGSAEFRVQIGDGTYAVSEPDAYADEIPKLVSFGILVLGLLAIWSLNRQPMEFKPRGLSPSGDGRGVWR